MSEELNKNQEVKKKLKKTTEQYQYISQENEQLIVDKPSEPLIKKDSIMKTQTEANPIIKSNKELYESYLKELKHFYLIINGEIIYDSSLDKTKEYSVKFENDYFILYGKKYSYNGLRIQKK